MSIALCIYQINIFEKIYIVLPAFTINGCFVVRLLTQIVCTGMLKNIFSIKYNYCGQGVHSTFYNIRLPVSTIEI